MLNDVINQKGLEKIIGTGSKYFGRFGRVAGRFATVATVIVTAYSVTKKFRAYLKNDPNAKKIAGLSREHQKWTTAISCLGSDPYSPGYICAIEKGGAINALGEKISISKLTTRYPEGACTFDPEPEKAKKLIQKSINKVVTATDNLGIENYTKTRIKILDDLNKINAELEPEFNPKINYTPYQQEISNIVRKMYDIEWDYNKEISRRVKELHKKIPIYLAKAGWEGTFGELLDMINDVFKITKKKKK